MSMELHLVTKDDEIEACFEAFSALRPHLRRGDFLSRVRLQQQQGYRILGLNVDGKFPAAAGFRTADFLAWGKVLYIDDLTTVPQARGRGHASRLLEWLIDFARAQQCDAVHLDSGYGRHDAHRLYLKMGFKLSSHHFAMELGAP
jgi:GNAT superfamily N-acetyltransferase